MKQRYSLVTSVFATLIVVGTIPVKGIRSERGEESGVLSATKEVLSVVSRLRGLEVKNPVKAGLKSRDEIERAVINDLDENTTPAEFEASRKTLTKLGLVPRDFHLREYVIRLLREQVAGFYEPKTQEFFLAAWLPLPDQKPVMAHELTHALQDQHFNLRRFERWPKGDSDAELAAHALVEGDATVVMLQYSVDQEGRSLDVTKIGSLTALLQQQVGSDRGSQHPVLAAAPAVVRESLQFPYVYGVGFVQEVLKAQSRERLDRSYAALPLSTEQIIHPERFLIRDNPVVVILPSLSRVLRDGWKQVDADVNGEFGYSLILGEFIGREKALQAAAGWGGDRYLLFEHQQSKSLLLAQYTTWDTEADAREFFSAYCERTEKRYGIERTAGGTGQAMVARTAEGFVSIRVRGRDVIIVEGAPTSHDVNRIAEAFSRARKNP